MYGKIFEAMFDGSLYGHWEAIITFQNMIVIADQHGVVDMTPQAISGRTSIPVEFIQKGIEVLSQPDERSRTPGENGVRIALLDEHRDWGWRIVNYQKYRDLNKREDKRKADRERLSSKRADERKNDRAPLHEHLKPKPRKSPPNPAERFDEFWAAYPKRKNRKDALKVWQRDDLDGKAEAIIAAVIRSTRSDREWLKDEGQFIPLPTTYLNNERWNDEIKTDIKRGATVRGEHVGRDF